MTQEQQRFVDECDMDGVIERATNTTWRFVMNSARIAQEFHIKDGELNHSGNIFGAILKIVSAEELLRSYLFVLRGGKA